MSLSAEILHPGAVDGIEICSSFARCCDACMEREIQHKVNGEMQADIQYYHRIVVVVLVSTDFRIPLGVRFRKNSEAEASWALALLQDLTCIPISTNMRPHFPQYPPLRSRSTAVPVDPDSALNFLCRMTPAAAMVHLASAGRSLSR